VEMAQHQERAEPLMFSQLNARLHAVILRAAHDDILERMLSSLKYAVVRYQLRTVLVPGRLEESITEHQRIVQSLRARDPEAAEHAARGHVARVRQVLEHSADLLA